MWLKDYPMITLPLEKCYAKLHFVPHFLFDQTKYLFILGFRKFYMKIKFWASWTFISTLKNPAYGRHQPFLLSTGPSMSSLVTRTYTSLRCNTTHQWYLKISLFPLCPFVPLSLCPLSLCPFVLLSFFSFVIYDPYENPLREGFKKKNI